jgi:hypothetical protein
VSTPTAAPPSPPKKSKAGRIAVGAVIVVLILFGLLSGHRF